MPDKTTLVTDIADWTNRTDLPVDTILRIAQAMIDRDTRSAAQVVSSTLTAPAETDGITVLTLPTEVLEVRSVVVSETSDSVNFVQPDSQLSVSFTSPGAFEEIRLSRAGGKLDRIYTLVGRDIRFFPALAEGETVYVVYHKLLPRLGDDDANNDVLQNAYDMYLYAGLTATGVFLQDAMLEQQYYRMYNDTLVAYRRTETRKFFPVLVEDIRLTATGVRP